MLPPFVHLRMGYSAVLAGLAISIQYIATLASRPWAGRISDHMGAKVSVLWGMACCTASGALLVGAAAFAQRALAQLYGADREPAGAGRGREPGVDGSYAVGHHSAGQEHTAKVIGMNGISTYGGMALAAPLGVVLDQQWGLASIGVLTILIGAVSFVLAWQKAPVPVEPGEHLPFAHVLGRVAPHGMGLALGGVGYSVLATFVTLFYHQPPLERRGALPDRLRRRFRFRAHLLFIRTISRFGGYPVAIVSLLTEAVGMVLLWQATAPWMAMAGAAVGGLGLSLVFPAIGVEAVKRVPEFNRGTALGVYTAFADVSFFLVGPIAGALIGYFGYASVFLFALISVLIALGIVVVLKEMQAEQPQA